MSAIDYALLAQEAYSAAPDIGVAGNASCAIVRDTAAGRVIAFPGTDSFADLLTDFDVDPDHAPLLGPIHGGFWQTYAAMKAQIVAAAAGQTVTFVGHSLGAALAIVAAADFVANGNAVGSVYGFAPPKVSPQNTINTVLARTQMFLFRNGNDVVPIVPPLWYRGSPAIQQIGKPSLPFPNLKDHALALYIAALPNGQTPAN
jgi:triacylglycerol lipase